MKINDNKVRTPRQTRSKNKVEAILKATKELIEIKGSRQVKIQEIAKKANVSIGAIYQYFTDKDAIIYAIFEQYLEGMQKMIRVIDFQVNSLEELSKVLDQIFEQYYNIYQNDIVLLDICENSRFHRHIQERDIEFTKENISLVFEIIAPLIAEDKHEDFKDYMFISSFSIDSMMKIVTYLKTKDEQSATEILKATKKLFSVRFLKALFG